MSNTVLHNHGQRSITVGKVVFAPKQTRKFNKADTDLLLKLYPDEVEDVEAAGSKFKVIDDSDDEKLPEKDPTFADKTVPEIKAFLDEKGAAYDDKAKKAVLAALADHIEAGGEFEIVISDEDDGDDNKEEEVEDQEEEGSEEEIDLSEFTKKELQKYLTDEGVEFESDANKDRLIDLTKKQMAAKSAE